MQAMGQREWVMHDSVGKPILRRHLMGLGIPPDFLEELWTMMLQSFNMLPMAVFVEGVLICHAAPPPDFEAVSALQPPVSPEQLFAAGLLPLGMAWADPYNVSLGFKSI
jgi:hypothetical protein